MINMKKGFKIMDVSFKDKDSKLALDIQVNNIFYNTLEETKKAELKIVLQELGDLINDNFFGTRGLKINDATNKRI